MVDVLPAGGSVLDSWDAPAPGPDDGAAAAAAAAGPDDGADGADKPVELGPDGKPIEGEEEKKKAVRKKPRCVAPPPSPATPACVACLRPALTACRRSRRVTPELLMGETGLERLAKISRDKNAFKRTRDVVRTPHPRP